MFVHGYSYGIFLFLKDLLKPYIIEFSWNDFFQFAVYFSLAPMPAVVYGI